MAKEKIFFSTNQPKKKNISIQYYDEDEENESKIFVGHA